AGTAAGRHAGAARGDRSREAHATVGDRAHRPDATESGSRVAETPGRPDREAREAAVARHQGGRSDLRARAAAPRADRGQEAALRARARGGEPRGADHHARPHAQTRAGHARTAARSAGPPASRGRRRGRAAPATRRAGGSRCRAGHPVAPDRGRLPAPARAVHRDAALADGGGRACGTRRRRAGQRRAAVAPGEDGSARGGRRGKRIGAPARGRRPPLMAMLELYLIRHGVAAERGEDWPDDSKRPLTSDGIAKLRKEARGLAALDVAIEQIVCSPLVRTRQTADVIAETLKSKPGVVTSDALAPAGTPAAVIQELSKYVRKRSAALVGHEPNLGELAAHLIGARHAIEFKKGAVCRIDFEVLPPKGSGQLRW